jgi:ribosomal protein S8
MYQLGLLRDVTIVDSTRIEVFLKYIRRECAFKHIKLISVPGKRVYISLVRLSKLKEKSNASMYIISTSEGLKTDYECILSKLSGELLLKIEF